MSKRPISINPEFEEIQNIYCTIRKQIEKRLLEFRHLRNNGTARQIFTELAFCIFTPQSKARSCWSAVETLLKKNLMFIGNADEIKREINSVRFRNKKSEYLVKAREQLLSGSRITIKDRLNSLDSPIEMREWLVSNVKGIGYKEASHFLRNIGYGDCIAILDRHILKNLKVFGVINKIPGNLSEKIYMELENKMIGFAGILEIPVGHLDFVFWYREAGEVFK